MLFNFGTCKCLHTGHGNLAVNYKIGDTVLGTTVKENDLGKNNCWKDSFREVWHCSFQG